MDEKLDISIRPICVKTIDGHHEITVREVVVMGPGKSGIWTEAFSTATEEDAFLRGLKCATALWGKGHISDQEIRQEPEAIAEAIVRDLSITRSGISHPPGAGVSQASDAAPEETKSGMVV